MTSPTLLYAYVEHADALQYDANSHLLIASGDDGETLIVMEPLSLIALGREMIKLGRHLAAQEASL